MHKAFNEILGIRNFAVTKDTALGGGKGWMKNRWVPYYSIVHGLLTIPLPILILAVLGCWYAAGSGRDELGRGSVLVLSWAAVPVLFCTLPYMAITSSIREFLPYIPGVCLLAGVGADKSYPLFSRLVQKYLATEQLRRKVYGGLIGLVLLLEALSVYKYHPYEITFFNALIGGLKGAQSIRIPFSSRIGIPDAEDHRGTSFRNAIKWLDEHARPRSILVSYSAHTVKYLPMKNKIPLLPRNWDSQDEWRKALEDMDFDRVYIIFNNTYWNRIHPLYGYCYNNLTPIHTISANGAPITWIYEMPKDEFLKLIKTE